MIIAMMKMMMRIIIDYDLFSPLPPPPPSKSSVITILSITF